MSHVVDFVLIDFFNQECIVGVENFAINVTHKVLIGRNDFVADAVNELANFNQQLIVGAEDVVVVSGHWGVPFG